MNNRLREIVETMPFDADAVRVRLQEIHRDVLETSVTLDAPNFTRLHTSDLEALFAYYDQRCFEGQVSAALGDTPLTFRLSNRMTRAGGQTAHYRRRDGSMQRYEIAASTTILFGCFHDNDHREITASGIRCQNRLEALQRVMEHEMAHLVELILWDQSSCSKSRFHSITLRFFGHTENRHQMITPRERAREQFGIRPGVAVCFDFEGVEHCGFVNRVTKRATVLVEDSQGVRYSDGKRYKKYYVPVPQLRVIETRDAP